MSAYQHPRNTSVMHASANIESVRPRSNDEARATWAAKYYSRGLHRANGKPRIRVTVPPPREHTAHSRYDMATDPCSPRLAASVRPGDLNAGLRGDSALPLPAARAGAFPIDKRELPNMSPEQWDEWERAFGPEPNIPEER